MTHTLRTIGLAAFAALTFAGCKKSGPTGAWVLDKAEMKAAVNRDIEKLPKERQQMAKAMAGVLDVLEVRLELQDGGKAKMFSKMPSLGGGDPKIGEKEGSWRQEGNRIIVSAADEKDVTCDLDGARLTCTDGKSPTSLVFRRD
ncbi:MAG: hypothetical protein IRZ16_09125 [Myxococcaceae bacterium]|nr:hypothetical protein [Myxococcaceae bacterium]